MTIFAIYDLKAKKFVSYYVVDNTADFIRSIVSLVNSGKEENNLVKYSDEFELYKIGVIDSIDGSISALHELVGLLSDFRGAVAHV
uniref:Nonstructural protein n=1 Tax=Dulem virus 197 TaxID=3145674 RepID=A0AAU8B4Y7_9VIRU